MKHLVVVIVCSFVATSVARPEVNQDALKESGRRIKQAHQKCQSDPATAVDEAAIKNLRNGGPPPANSGPHTLCISKALGWQNEDGSVNKANIESRAQAIFGENADLQKIVNECVVSKDNAEATALHLFECYRRHAPHPEGPHEHHEHH